MLKILIRYNVIYLAPDALYPLISLVNNFIFYCRLLCMFWIWPCSDSLRVCLSCAVIKGNGAVGEILNILQLLVTLHNLLTAMMKSLWSLKVIRGSERHLVNKKKRAVVIYFLSDTGLLYAATFLCESEAAVSVRLTPGEVWQRHYEGNDDSWQLRTCSWRGELTWGNSSDRWWWFCCPTSLDPGPCPQVPWMLLETHFIFITTQLLSCKLSKETSATWHDLAAC